MTLRKLNFQKLEVLEISYDERRRTLFPSRSVLGIYFFLYYANPTTYIVDVVDRRQEVLLNIKWVSRHGCLPGLPWGGQK